ncbi:asparagine synthase (glutamine-hydrolyzing) [soil metagenome]
MCGIAGYVQRRSSPPARALRDMLDRLVQRGPDAAGHWTADRDHWHIELGHRRLSIIDLAGGSQPMGNETSSVQITFNGEIYNAAELRADLQRRGHQFRTRCDTESIIHQFEEIGTAGFALFNGMFAFAIWDQDAGTLTLARDRAGIKPLYYANLPDGGLAFASELTALMAHPAVSREIDSDSLASYFFRDYVSPPRTIIRSVNKLEPGHFLVWKDGATSPAQPFWTRAEIPEPSLAVGSVEQNVRQLRRTLVDAVEAHLMSDVPVGVLLSGGIDSSLVAALAQQQVPGISTFSVGFEDADFDESNYARLLAETISSHHHEVILSEDDLLEHLDDALDALDEPLADPSILPTFLVSQLAAQHVKVVLGGDGGDELFGGYPTYKAHRLARIYSMIPRGLRDRVVAPLVQRLPARHSYQSLDWKMKRFILRWADDPIVRHQRWMSSADLPDVAEAMCNPTRSVLASPPELVKGYSSDDLNGLLAYDFATYLSGSVLTKVDRASMAHSLEVRTPLLDNRLIDFAFSLPAAMKVRGLETKYLLKLTAQDLLPDEIIHRPKRGFAIPLAKWISGAMRSRFDAIFEDSPLWNLGVLRRERFQRWQREHIAKTADHSKPLWALLVLDHWYRSMLRSDHDRRSDNSQTHATAGAL